MKQRMTTVFVMSPEKTSSCKHEEERHKVNDPECSYNYFAVPAVDTYGTFPFHQVIRVADTVSANTVSMLMKSYERAVTGAEVASRKAMAASDKKRTARKAA